MEKPVLKSHDEIVRHDGEKATVVGRYQSIPRPRKGPPTESAKPECAVLVLDDGTQVFLESLDSPQATRTQRERDQFDGKRVRITGTCHKIMPARGAGLVSPSINEITEIRADN